MSVSSNGAQANSNSGSSLAEGPGPVAISADGRFIASESAATNLIARDTNRRVDVFLRDRVARTTERVSTSLGGKEGNNLSASPALSGDGRFVAFYSYASNLVTGDTNRGVDVFVHDRAVETTERVSVSSRGVQANNSYEAQAPALSVDGRVVAFSSDAPNLVAGDKNDETDVFVRDRVARITKLVSVARR